MMCETIDKVELKFCPRCGSALFRPDVKTPTRKKCWKCRWDTRDEAYKENMRGETVGSE
jgi:ribosomal protein S27AE